MDKGNEETFKWYLMLYEESDSLFISPEKELEQNLNLGCVQIEGSNELNGRGYEQLSVVCAMERIAYSLCYVGA